MGPAMVLAPREEEAGRHTALPNSSGAPPGLRVGTTNQPGLSEERLSCQGKWKDVTGFPEISCAAGVQDGSGEYGQFFQ